MFGGGRVATVLRLSTIAREAAKWHNAFFGPGVEVSTLRAFGCPLSYKAMMPRHLNV